MTFASMRPLAAIAFAASLTWAGGQGSARAQEDDFLACFAGTWSGSGTVQRSLEENPTKVSCSLTGKGGGSAASVAGSCRAMAIFTRKIGISLQYDPGSKRYTGTYTGSRRGIARLSGRRSGDALNLTIT